MTGTTAAVLRERANRRLRGAQRMSQSLFSYILRGSRRCSAEKAWALHLETGNGEPGLGVPMAELTRWPKSSEAGNSMADNGDSSAKH